MIAFWCDWDGNGSRLDERIAASLGLFAPVPASFWRSGRCLFSQLREGHHRKVRWIPYTAPDGRTTLFNGYLDNSADIASALGLSGFLDDPASIYAHARLAWGDQADHRCIGSYCAIEIDRGQDELRMVRSPLSAPPIHFWHEQGHCVAASVPRVLLAAGLTARLDSDRLAANILLDQTDEVRGWYVGARRVPLGSRVIATRSGVHLDRYYDPLSIPIQSCSESDALDGARHFLGEAGALGVAGARRPGIFLSGGLDSPLMALSLLDALPDEQDLPSYTFTPATNWDGEETASLMGDEQSLVEGFSRRYPRVRPRFFRNDAYALDHRFNDLFLAIGEAPPSLPSYSPYHALWEAARKDGCDRIVTADLGNFCYSQFGDWAAAEYLRRGKWREMRLALDTDPDDRRSTLRQFMAKALMPNVPLRTRYALRWLTKGAAHSRRTLLSAATDQLASRHAASLLQSANEPSFADFFPRDRNESNAHWIAVGDGGSEDIRQGFEQLYGIRQRDMSAYRPLVEFCLSLPTERFNSGGVTRRLARRLGEGRLPDEIRLNRRTGKHGIDWHIRIGRQRLDLIQRLERYRNDADLAAVIDFDRLITSLTNWPEQSSHDIAVWGPRFVGVGQAILNAEFVRFVDGRNAV